MFDGGMNKIHEKPIIDPRISVRHPEITSEEVMTAWRTMIRFRSRHDGSGRWSGVGFDGNGRELELVFSKNKDRQWVVFHAFTPPTRTILEELGLCGKKRRRK